MVNTFCRTFLGCALALISFSASAQNSGQIGTPSCDVSRGIGMFVVEKQTLSCVFKDGRNGTVENYTGSIDEFGVALGEVASGHLVWGVVAATSGLPTGALASTYTGVGATPRSGSARAQMFSSAAVVERSLQPISIEGQEGINIAGGVTTVTLKSAPRAIGRNELQYSREA